MDQSPEKAREGGDTLFGIENSLKVYIGRVKALNDPATVARFTQLGVAVAGGGSDDFHKQIVREYRNWVDVARAANIKAQ